uniref:N-acetylserotonin O-methyltransferase-like protein n=1 Tax=Caligus clemensi TaxID=344056 RepID=C1C230_CALCM|nr:N-acetylserotonin O-methyltransferase-like protein [Caligus clemensi]
MLEPFSDVLRKGYEIVLSSASPRRKEILSLGLPCPFRVQPSTAEENLNKKDYLDKPQNYAMDTASLKSKAVMEAFKRDEEKNLLIIGSDTVIFFQGAIIGKPQEKEDAIKILESLSGKSHEVYSGVSLLFKAKGSDDVLSHSFFEETKLHFDNLPADVIKAYVDTGVPMDKAGAYGIQALGGTLIKRIEGDYYNVMGFPLHKFSRFMYDYLSSS